MDMQSSEANQETEQEKPLPLFVRLLIYLMAVVFFGLILIAAIGVY